MIVITPMLGDEGAVGIVEVKMAGELLGGGIADGAATTKRLGVAEEADGHVLLSGDRGLGPALAGKRGRALARPPLRVDIGVER